MQQYLDLMQHILDNGVLKTDRTGTGTKSVFGHQMRFDLKEGFPLLTTKKLFTKGIIAELLWFLNGDTNAKTLQEQGVKIWDEWAPSAKSLANAYFQNGINILAKKSSEEGRNLGFPDDIISHIQDPMYTLLTKDRIAVPAGWDITESSKDTDGQPFLECYHPQFWDIFLDLLIKHNYAPANARDKIGDLGPVYGKQWRDWKMVVEEEDLSIDALLQQHIDWCFQTNSLFKLPPPNMGREFLDDDGSTVLGYIYKKSYDASFKYMFHPASSDPVSHVVNTQLFEEKLKSLIKNGQTTGPITKISVKGFDQIDWLINRLKTQPDCRRMIVSAWNVADLPKMALSPCHALFQFWTRPLSRKERFEHSRDVLGHHVLGEMQMDDDQFNHVMDELNVPKYALSCQLYQRSADVFLGVPFNIASYALLTMMIAQVTNMVADEFIWTGGDTHLYVNHMEQVATQLKREPHPLPKMKINPDVKDIFSFKLEDFTLEGYEHHPAIKAPVAV